MKNKGWHSPTILRRSPWAVLPCLLLLVPAFFTSCGRDIYDDIGYVLTDMEIWGFNATKAEVADGIAINTLDMFVFNNDKLGKLDSYERLEHYSGGTVRTLSTVGEKCLVAVANLPDQTLRTASISCLEDILQLTMRFEDENDISPILSGITEFTAGSSDIYGIRLEPLCCGIIISGIEADEGLSDIKVHLENINATCRLFPESGTSPSEYIETGQVFDYYPGITLYCFPNGTLQESLGSYFTELVIEGVKNGETFSCRIKINEGKGLEKNVKYYLSIRIAGKDGGDVVETGSMTLHPGNIITGADGEDIRIWVEVNPPSTEVIFDREDLEFDKERGIYDYTPDPDGKGVTLHLLRGGTGMFCIDAGPPVNDGCLVIVVCNP